MTMYTLVVLMAAETIASYLGASIVERLERRKTFVTVAGLATHGAWFVFGFAILLAPVSWFLPLAFALLLWRGFFDGMLIAPWFDLAARVLEPDERARFFSVRLFTSSGALLAGAAVARAVFGWVEASRMQFAWIFWIGGAMAVMSDFSRLAYREKATEVLQERRDRSFGRDLADMWRMLASRKSFRRLCLIGAAGGLTFNLYPQLVSLFATNRVGMSRAGYATLTVVLQASTVIACIYLPRLVKAYGWRNTYGISLVQMGIAIGGNGVIACTLGAMEGQRAAGMLAATFVVLGASRAWIFAEANVLYEMVPEDKRPSGLVLLRSVSNVVGIVIAIVLANFSVTERAESVPYPAMFFAIAGVMAGAALLLFFGVRTKGELSASAR
jgi:MFS family permease